MNKRKKQYHQTQYIDSQKLDVVYDNVHVCSLFSGNIS